MSDIQTTLPTATPFIPTKSGDALNDGGIHAASLNL